MVGNVDHILLFLWYVSIYNNLEKKDKIFVIAEKGWRNKIHLTDGFIQHELLLRVNSELQHVYSGASNSDLRQATKQIQLCLFLLHCNF